MQNMRKKMFFTLMVSLFAAFCLVGTSMAANTVTIKSDKPIIPKSSCGHAGNITMQFDNGTTLHEGDVIRFKLDNTSTVCGDINYFLVLASKGRETIANAADDPIQTSENITGSVITSRDGTVVGSGVALTGSNGTSNGSTIQVGFLVQATDGSQFINVTVAARITSANPAANQYKVVSDDTQLTIQLVTSGSSETFDVHLFDGNQKSAFFFEPSDLSGAPSIYDDQASDNLDKIGGNALPNEATDVDFADNVLCINTANFTGSGGLDHAIPESRPFNNNSTYQLSFLGDYIVAQLVSAVTYDIRTACKDDICNYVPIGTTVDQQGVETKATGHFDFGNYGAADGSNTSAEDRWIGSGYCETAKYLGNGLLFYKDGDTFSSGDRYRVTLTLSAGASVDKAKAAWDNTGVQDYWTSSSAGGNCSKNATQLTAIGGGGWQNGTNSDTTVLQKTYTITASEIDKNALMLDLPQIDLGIAKGKVHAGDKIYVEAVVTKLPCGGPIIDKTFCLAELVDTCPAATQTSIDGIAFIGDRQLTRVLHGYLGRLAGLDKTTNQLGYQTQAGGSLFFPYAPALNDSDFFTGLVVDNTGTSDVKLTLTLTDAAGGMATYTSDTVKAGTQWVNVLDNLKDNLVEGTTPLDLTKTVTVSVTAAAQ
jgi:hypothetical protein